MVDMPEPQLQQKIQNLEKVESYLKQQVNELEDDRKELYDLLREDKKTIHDLKVKLRSVELSEENLKTKLNQISDEETRLLEENDNLESKIQELELSLSLLARKPGIDKTTLTDPENDNKLKSENEELKKIIEELKNKPQDPNSDDTFKKGEKEALLKTIADLRRQLEESQNPYYDVDKLKKENALLLEREKALSDKLNSLEFENLENQLRKLKEGRSQPESVKEPIELKKVNDEDRADVISNMVKEDASRTSRIPDNDVTVSREKVVKSDPLKDYDNQNVIDKLNKELDYMKRLHQQALQDNKENEETHETERQKLLDRLKTKDSQIQDLNLRLEDMENVIMRSRNGRNRDVQTDESSFDRRGKTVGVQSDEGFFEKKGVKRMETQTDESVFSNGDSRDALRHSDESCQTDDVDVRNVVYTRNRDTQTPDENENEGRYFKNKGVQAGGAAEDGDDDDDDVMTKMMRMMPRNKAAQTDDVDDEAVALRRMMALKDNEIKALNEDMEELRQELNDKSTSLKKISNEVLERDDVIQEQQRRDKQNNQKIFMLIEASKQDKSTLENELASLRNILLGKDTDLETRTQETTSLLERLSTTEQDLVKSEQTRVALQDENAAIIMSRLVEIASLKKNIADKDDEVKTLWADMNKIQKNYTEYIEKSERDRLTLEDRVNELVKELTNRTNELEMLTSEHERAGEKLKTKEEEVRRLVEKENQTLAELLSLRRNVASKDDEVKMLLSDLNGLQHKYATLVQDHELCAKTEADLRRDFEACKADLKASRDRNMELTRQLDSKEARLDFLERNNGEWEERLKMAEAEVDELKHKLQQTELKNEFLTSTNEQRQRLVAMTVMREKTTKEAEDSLASTQVSFLKKTIESKDEEIRMLTDDVNNLHKKVLELMQKSGGGDNEADDATTSVKDKAVERLTMELMRKREEIQTLMNNERVLEDRYQKVAEDKHLLSMEHESAKKTLTNDIKDKMAAIEEKQRQLKTITDQYADLQMEHDDLVRKHADLNGKLTQLNEVIKVTTLQNKELLGQCKAGQTSLKEKEETEKKLTAQVKDLQREVSNLRTQLTMCTKDRNALEEAVDRLRRQAAEMQNDLNDRQRLEVKGQQMARGLQEKDKQIQTLLEKVNGSRAEIDSLLAERRELQQMEKLFLVLRREFDQLAAFSQKQSKDLQASQAKEQNLIFQIREKESRIDELNSELSRCSDLSRKLNILNISG